MPTPSTPADHQITLFNAKEIPNAFRKAVQVVHSKPLSSLTLLQRKMLNAWLKAASQSKPDDEGFWDIRIDEMANDIGFNSNNRKYLKESAEALMQIVFQWDVVAPEEKRAKWKASVLFPDVEMSREVIRFTIGQQLREHVLNPATYAWIDQSVMRKYRRAASAAIYEHCVRFEKIDQTTTVPWQSFRDIILGVSSGKKTYAEYKTFKAKVMNPAIAEINAEGSINIKLMETKSGKSVDGVFFKVSKPKKPGTGIELDDEVMSELLGQMVKLGVLASEARRLLKQETEAEIRQAIEYTNARRSSKRGEKLENPAAYFRKALSEKWRFVEPLVEDVQAKVKTEPKPPRANLAEQFKLRRMSEANSYFKELDLADQSLVIVKYNAQQTTKGLKVGDKATKGAEAAFYQWLVRDLWGEPTQEQLLDFADSLLVQK